MSFKIKKTPTQFIPLLLLTTETAQPKAAGPQCASGSCSGDLTALFTPEQLKALQRGEGHTPAVLLSQPVWGHGVVFGVLKGSTSGGSCTWRNLCCSLLLCSFPVYSPLMEAEKSSMSDFREIYLKPNSTYLEREKCGTTLIPRQW